ncbi:5-hydroxytryptamine receptor 1A-like [Stylophora pistillata]|uniref:5-hydroxytryptamine receptor 1A-like n=1 Tax=Stylophora pistillata TaxID=50429 RepID=UPI000C0391C7|nr:5-hydroxytryptamine receptor 1A-like [Stylophora pistillata]XP_022795503.1 5-hydroxytryptamine receptor 1A-like [Stylophora pistillata]
MDDPRQLQNHVSDKNSSKTIVKDEFALQSHWGPMPIAIASFLVVLICLATVGNLVVCRLVWVCRRMQIPSLYFVASMSFSDFLTGLLVLPISLSYHITYQSTGRWTFGHFTCDLYLFLNFILCTASIYNLCVVSGDRYLAVTSPLTYLSRMNECRVKQIIGVSWLCALLLAGFVTYGTHASKENGVNCSIWGLQYEYSVFVLVIAYIIPVFFLVFVNGKVFLIAHAQMTRIHVQQTSLAPVSTFIVNLPSQEEAPKKSSQRTRLKREIKIFKTFLIVTCTFLISWTPFIVILMIDSISAVPGLIRHSSIILLYCNSALNPFIYGFFNAEIRKSLSEISSCKCTLSFKR